MTAIGTRHYSNPLAPTHLTARVEADSTVIHVESKDGLPTAFPFTLTLGKREAVDVLADAGPLAYEVARGVDDTPIGAHEANAVVSHDTTARDWREAMTYVVGPPGPQGPQGEPGARRYYGTGAPGTIIGARPGDEYLDTDTGDLYFLG